jgi:transaldolase
MNDPHFLPPETLLDRLLGTAPGLEIWWDSSPLIYDSWMNKMVAAAPEDKRTVVAAQLRRLFDPQNPRATLFTGVTTNPPLSLAAINDNPARWAAWVENYARAHPGQTPGEVGWALYKEIVRLGAEVYMPVFEASDYAYGHLSGQVDPHYFFDADTMFDQAVELSRMSPNIAIKIPGTREGMGVLRRLTACGIATNCTAAYTVPQFVAAAEAVQAGLLDARAAGVDLTRWRSVITYMSARWEAAPEFDRSCEGAGFTLTLEDRRWAAVAIFKQAYRVFRQRAYPSKLLICSLRMGPTVDGVLRCWHMEETAGGRVVFTLPPPFLTELFAKGEHLTFEPLIRRDIPADVMARLQRVPYFRASFEPDGLRAEEFNTLPPLLSTHREFSEAVEKITAFAAAHMEPQKETMT